MAFYSARQVAQLGRYLTRNGRFSRSFPAKMHQGTHSKPTPERREIREYLLFPRAHLESNVRHYEDEYATENEGRSRAGEK